MKSVSHRAFSSVALPNVKPSFSHDAWPSRVVAWTMLAIATTFELLYIDGRACFPRVFQVMVDELLF
jgi:hypothetical protein